MSERILRQLEADMDLRPRAEVVSAISHATIGEQFTVKHSLQTKPSIVVPLPLTDCRVWAEEADERIWTPVHVVLRCSVALAPLRLLVVE